MKYKKNYQPTIIIKFKLIILIVMYILHNKSKNISRNLLSDIVNRPSPIYSIQWYIIEFNLTHS